MTTQAERDRDYLELMRARNMRRKHRLDIAPEHRPVLWGEADQASGDIDILVGWLTDLLALKDNPMSEDDVEPGIEVGRQNWENP